MADYLSSHPFEMQGATVKAETLWNEWFTVNSVISLNDVLEANATTSENRANDESERNSIYRVIDAKNPQPIRKQDERELREQSKIHCSQSVKRVKVAKKSQNSAIKLLNEKMLPANYAADKNIQRVIAIIKKYNKSAVNRLPPPWREKFQSFSLDSRDFLYMDNRLVIPQSMRQRIMSSLHYGHPGRDAMLSMVAGIWWPRIHREVNDQARLGENCLQAGKNLKCVLSQTGNGKIPVAKEKKEEIVIDFAGPFQNAKEGKSVC